MFPQFGYDRGLVHSRPLHIIFSGIATAAESSTIVDGIQPEIGASL
jgi:hypothetical protein